MAIIDGFRAELEYESKATRKTLERIPEDKFEWRPHPKSFTMMQLAAHTVEMHGWIVDILTKDGLDFKAMDYKAPVVANRAELLAMFDKELARGMAAMSGVDDAKMMQPWTLRAGDHVIFTLPRVATVRTMVMNHVVHHRAQLGVYFRLLDVPVPSTYGPSADEQ